MATSDNYTNAIELKGVRVYYRGADEPALAIDHLTIKQGDFVAVIGPSGAGKSTFLRCLNRLIAHQKGVISIYGRVHRKKDLIELRQQVSMVFQNFNLAPRLSVLDNVLVGRLAKKRGLSKILARFDNRDREVAFNALQKVGMLTYAMRDIRQLSGGQKQRVAIARCLAQESKIILADEPVASLDPVNSRRIIELLKKLNVEQNITILVNLHQIDLVEKYFSSVVGLKQGKLHFHQQSGDESSRVDWQKVYR